MTKNINAKCHCGEGLPWIKEEVIMLDPCEHLIHKKCFNKLLKCPYCKSNVSTIIRASDFKQNCCLYQKCIDILSMTNFDLLSRFKMVRVIDNIPSLLSTIARIPFIQGVSEGKKLINDIFSLNNINIHVTGLTNIRTEHKVFIANHTSHLDFMTIFYVLGTGFLSSSSIYDNPISKQLTNIIPLLVIERGKKWNTVEKMREYVQKYKSICLFPEGMLTHPDTIIKFRTGAFHIGYPVYPIVLKYDPVIADMSASDFILKISSGHKINIFMTILEPFYPPFDDAKIENIRKEMAYAGNMAISRVSNRDIIDKT